MSTPAASAARVLPRAVPVLCLIYAAFLFLLTYLADPDRPGGRFLLGWYDHRLSYDQWQYYQMVLAIPHGSLGPFQYPVGYPFLGFLGGLLFGRDPFLLPDLALFLVFIYASVRVFWIAFENVPFIAVLTVVLIHAACANFEKPWTTTVSAAAVAVVLFVYLSACRSATWGAICGLCLASAFAARIGDVVIVGTVFALILFDLWREKTGVRFLVGAAAAAVPIVALILAVNHKFSGLWLGNYYSAVTNQTWCFSCIPWKLYGYATDPFTFQGAADARSIPLLQAFPLLPLAPLGLLFLFFESSRRRIAYGASAVFTGWLLIYAPFHAVTGSTLQNGSVHYAKILLPAIVCCAGAVLISVAGFTGKQRKATLWYAAAVAVVLLGVAMAKPRKLDLQGVHLSSNVNPGAVWLAIDGNPATRWTTAAPQREGMEYDIDFEKTIWLNHIDLDTTPSPSDTARQLSILASMDGKTWRELLAYEGIGPGGAGHYYVNPTRVRQLRLVLRRNDPTYYWSIHELAVYGW